MAPNNALGRNSAASLRAKDEKKSQNRRTNSPARISTTPDAFGAGMIDKSTVAARGTGTAVKTPLEEFENKEKSEVRTFFTALMFVTRLPCPGWCDHHPGYLMRGMAYFPLVGSAVVGVWASAIYDAAASLWPPLIAAALSTGGTLWLTGCFHEDGLCDTLDGFGGGWTKSQILRIMKDSRSGSYATMGGGIWIVAKCAVLARLGDIAGGKSVWKIGASIGAGPAIVVAQGVARASAAPLIYCFEYIVDDEDAKGEYYNWFGESRRLLGPWRVLLALLFAFFFALMLLPMHLARRALFVFGLGTTIAGLYGKRIIGGVMGDFLGATICMLELAIYLAIAADIETFDPYRLMWLTTVVSTTHVYGILQK